MVYLYSRSINAMLGINIGIVLVWHGYTGLAQVLGHQIIQLNKTLFVTCVFIILHLVFWFQAYSPLGSPGTTWIKGDVLKNPILNMISEKLGKTPAKVALRWGLQMGQSVLPKSINESRIKENFEIFDWSIPEDLFVKFSEIEQASSYCFWCMY